MAHFDIEPFGEHESRTDDNTETGENMPFTPVGEDQLGKQTEESKKLHLEEESLKELN